jgi:hypothetical protein
MSARNFWALCLRLVGLGLVVAVIAGAGLHFYGLYSKTTLSLVKSYGVHVCTAAHFDAAAGVCTSDDRVLSTSGLSNAMFTAVALGDADTVGLTLAVRVSRQDSTGADAALGSAPLTVSRPSLRAVTNLSAIFYGAGVVPITDTTYQFEVDQHTAGNSGGVLATVTVGLTQ